MNKYTEEIEDKANILLRDTFQKIFEEANLKLLVQEHFKEKGVDFTFEIETRELIPETIEFISLQNKGTLNKVTPLKTTSKKGFISFQIDDIRHIDYWCQQLDRPFIFTLCDLTTNTIYWTALQLERDIYLKRVSELKLKSSRNRARSLQIYIDPKQKLIQNNIPCHDNFKVLFDQIQASKKIIIQREEDKFHFEKIDKFAFIEVDRSLHILDQLYQYMKIRFEFINILPHGFWARQYPFKVDKFPYFEYQNFTLHTDNKEIFDIFESIEIEKEEQVVLKNSIFFDGVKEVLEKIKFILDILNQNLVFNISCRPNNKIKSIRIFLKDTSIGSPSNFFNFRFDEVVHKISRTSSEDDKSQLAFLHYKLGNYVKAATIYLDLLVDVENVRKSSKYFIYAYNLSKLELFVRNRFSNEPIDDNLLSKLKRVKVVFENSTTLLNGDALIDYFTNADPGISVIM